MPPTLFYINLSLISVGTPFSAFFSAHSVSIMAGLGVSMGACFCLKIHKDVVAAVCAHFELVDFLPTELRRLIFAVVRAQDVRPCPTYVAAVSTLSGDSLEFYFFIGSDTEAFETVPGLHSIAESIQEDLRSYFSVLLPGSHSALLSSITVSWEPNILIISA